MGHIFFSAERQAKQTPPQFQKKAMGVFRAAGIIDDQPHHTDASADRADHIRPETRPMPFAGDNDGNLHVTETPDMIERIRIFGNIDDLIGDADAVERAIGGGALDAGGLAVNGDGHNFLSRSRFRTRLNIADCNRNRVAVDLSFR
ncbi:hypothetical protein D3C80_1542000 [compost metagenome]